MSVLVVDASVTLDWCFEDEATPWTDGLMERLRSGDQIVVPAHWPAEVSNGLAVALRRKRIKPGQSSEFWDQLARLPIEVDPAPTVPQSKAVLSLSEKHGLTAYDAAYLELSLRRQVPLGTLDTDLRKAASAEGVVLL